MEEYRLSDTFVLREAHEAEEEKYETLIIDTTFELGTLQTQVVKAGVTNVADVDRNEVIEEIDFMVGNKIDKAVVEEINFVDLNEIVEYSFPI